VAIATTWTTVATVTTGSTTKYTVPSTGYLRDLVLTAGTAAVFVGFGSGVTSAATTSSFEIPAGGTLVLTQCAVPNSGIIYMIGAAASTLSIGYGSATSYT
jgi:hypothetical protein